MSELAKQLIAECKANKSKVLDLGCCGLTSLPDELFELVWLEELYVCNVYFDYENKKETYSPNNGKKNILSEIPFKINQLKTLKKLCLNGNYDNKWNIKQIPFLDLPELQTLDISFNKISQLENLDKLPSLQTLDIRSNQISKLENLDNLPSLETLYIQDNQISKIENLNNLPNLQRFYISHNQISTLENLDNLPSLKRLEIYSNQIGKLENLDKLQNLQGLYIGSNQISKLENLDKLLGLQTLYIGSNQINQIKKTIDLPSLEILYISHNQISKLENLNNLPSLEILYISDNQINKLENLDKLPNLKVLDSRSNQISKLGKTIDLPSLKTFSISRNQISKLENLDKLPSLKTLYIRLNQISQIEKTVNLPSLEKLYFSSNQISKLENLDKLPSLERLDISSNQISRIEKTVDLPSLEKLNISHNQINQIQNLDNLPSLQELNISHNQISQIQNLDNLPSLQELNISHNQISQIQNLDNLLSLEILDISSNKISQIQNSDNLLSLEILDISSNKISQIQNLDNLPSLQELNISRNQISQIQNLDNLPSLEILDISYNKISQIQNLDNLPSLEKLYFSYNKISQIQNLDNLPSLETLYIKDNQISKLENLDKLSNLKELNINSNQIKDLTPLLPFIKKGISMSLSYNPWQKPPKNIVLQGTQTILNYFKDIENSKATSEKYIKLQIVGNGCVGKTTLVHRLLDKKYIDIPLKERTHGVIIRNWKLEDPTVIANVWDFGGQEIYHATHRLFLSPRTLYLLVYTPQKEYMPDETYFQPSYWLDYIADLGKGSRVILVQSKIDMSSDNLLSDDLEKLKRYYETHHGLQFGQNLKVSAKTNKGIRALRSEIAEQLEELQKQYKEILPENWLEVRIQIEELKADKSKHFLTYADYLAICKHRKVVSHDTLIAYLHDTGSLYYQKNLFDNKILLQQQWAIDGVYEILRDKHFLNNKRSIQFYELERIWKKHNLAEKRVFIGFMLSCEIAFELTDRQTEEEEKEYVVPQLLSAVAPPFAEFRHEKEVIYYKLTYLFLHQSIIERFIVRTAQTLKAGEAHYWKNGIAWRDSKSNTDIYVESVLASENVSSYERYLKVCLYGSRKAQFLYDIRKRFDGIRKINADAKEEISVDGKDWVTLHSFLENSGGNGVHYENNKSYKRNDFQLFGSFLQHFSRLEQPLRKREQKAMKVFIVYDAKDTEHFERLEKHLKILEREKKIEIWAKNKIIASDKVDEVTQENMQEADIVLLLISIDFLTNKELWEKEIKAALQREEEGKTRVIPIIVRQCEWERKEIFSFAENEPLPKNRLHLSRWPDADEFWSEISSGVHRLVKQPRQPFR